MLCAAVTAPALGFNVLRAAPQRHRSPAVQMQQLASEDDLALPVPATFLDGHSHNLKDKADYEAMYTRSVEDPSGFWADIANTFHWETPFTETVRSATTPPHPLAVQLLLHPHSAWLLPQVVSNFDSSAGKVESKWFDGGKTNICYNALDRHVAAGRGDQIAFYHEGNEVDDELQHWTYAQVLDEVSRVANVLKARGVKKGDKVTLFMPMVPQLPIAMLACARIGAVHSVVFGGFSAEARAGARGGRRGRRPGASFGWFWGDVTMVAAIPRAIARAMPLPHHSCAARVRGCVWCRRWRAACSTRSRRWW